TALPSCGPGWSREVVAAGIGLRGKIKQRATHLARPYVSAGFPGVKDRRYSRYIISMRITEIFFSIQGESTHAGEPCIFVRFTGCSLRCVYCDTKYAYAGGRDMSLQEVLGVVAGYPAK